MPTNGSGYQLIRKAQNKIVTVKLSFGFEQMALGSDYTQARKVFMKLLGKNLFFPFDLIPFKDVTI